MTEKNMVKADFYTSVVLMSFGITVTVMAMKMPVMHDDPYSSPGVLPVILGVIITSLSLVMFIRSIIRSRGRVGISSASVKTFFNEIPVRRMLLTTVLCLIYVFFLGKVMFALLTFIYIFVFIVLFEYNLKNPFRQQTKMFAIAGLVALCSSAAITAVFQYLFLVRLP